MYLIELQITIMLRTSVTALGKPSFNFTWHHASHGIIPVNDFRMPRILRQTPYQETWNSSDNQFWLQDSILTELLWTAQQSGIRMPDLPYLTSLLKIGLLCALMEWGLCFWCSALILETHCHHPDTFVVWRFYPGRGKLRRLEASDPISAVTPVTRVSLTEKHAIISAPAADSWFRFLRMCRWKEI